MDVSDLGALLAGLPPRYLIDESDSGILSLYYSTSDVSTIDECWVAFDCPGFSNAHLDGVARAMDSGLSEYEIVVVQQVSGFGSVFLAPVGCAKGMAERIGHAFVTLALSNVENQEKDSLGGYMSLLEGCVVHEVPVGTYEWTVVGREGLWRLRDNSIKSDLVVAEGVTTRLDLDLHQVGAIIVHPVLPNGDTYSGSLAMGIGPGLPTVGPDGKRRMSNGYVYSQARGPYVLPLLDPGEYTLKGMGPKWGLPSDGGWLTVKVESGVDLEVEVQVEDQ